jgi:histidinol phosphatase-like PHP family hydrolase
MSGPGASVSGGGGGSRPGFVPDFDHHIHTIYSGHSGADMFVPAVMARCAGLGLKRAVILEHVPVMMSESYASFHEWLTGRGDRAVIGAVSAEVGMRRTAHPDTAFLVGAEIDADPERLDGSLMLEDFSGLDLVLASTHVLPGGSGFWFSPPQIPAAERPALLRRWLAWLERIAVNPAVDVIAHPGAELHNCGLTGDFGASFRTAFAPVLDAMAAGGTAFELNESALRRLAPEALAGYGELVAVAAERGVKFSAGSDSHYSSSLGDLRLVSAAAAVAGLGRKDFIEPGRRAC